MKAKKSLVCLLACLMTVGAAAFGACDGQEIYNSVMSGLNSESLESGSDLDESSAPDEDSSVGESVTDGASESGQSESADESSSSDKNLADEEALAALQAAIEKTLRKGDNYQSRYVSTDTGKATINGEEYDSYYSEQESIMKKDGNKEEEIWNEKSRELPDGEWEYYRGHYINEYTGENSVNQYNYHYENGEWTKSSFSYSGKNDADETNEIIKLYQQLSEYLEYDRETGIYYIEERTLDVTDLMGEMEGLKNGVATATYHKLEIELKDGYIYRLYVDMEQYMKAISTEDGVEQVYEMHVAGEVTEYYTDWGTTVVTLPEIAEE